VSISKHLKKENNMAAKKNAETKAMTSSSGGSRLNRWGGNTKNQHLASGRKLQFTEEDQDCILLYMGSKDISDKVIDPATKLPKEPGSVIYSIFHDGKGVVSLATSYSFTDYQMEAGKFYYLHLCDFVLTKTGFTPMKDFEIQELGTDGETVTADEERTGLAKITLSLPTIRDLNYNKLNYPLRKV
jgi:hypothetical protein